MKSILKTILLAGSMSLSLAVADEGMWRPQQMPEIGDNLKKLGFKSDPKILSDLTAYPMNAVVSLGGCTASFVSPKGLTVTNHHCAYGSIQYNSKEDNNLLENGFLAKNFGEELPAAPGSRIYVTTAFTNVTDKVTGGLAEGVEPRQRYQAIEDRRKALVKACEEDKGYRCSVASYHGGLEYYLIKKLEIRDVRLVYAPPSSVGKYGGDIDNWRWPRHTGDFSFYRAYVSPDGKAADYSADNVPYEPKSYLKVQPEGVKDDDFVMVAGYPGRTNRYRRLAEVDHAFAWRYPTYRRLLQEWINTIDHATKDRKDARIKYESALAGLNNAMKNFDGQMEGAKKVGLSARKKSTEAALNAWIAENPERQKQYSAALEELDKLIAEDNEDQKREFYINQMGRAALLNTARDLYRLAREKQKPDAEREPGYQDRDMTFFKQRLERLDRRFDPKTDREVWKLFLTQYLTQPTDKRSEAFDKAMELKGGESDEAVDAKLAPLYEKTGLGDLKTRLAWMDKDPKAFENSDDPFIRLAVALYDFDMKREERDKKRVGAFQMLRPRYMEAIIAYNRSQNRPVYPDANSTLRITYGSIKGVSPADGLYYLPFTTIEGVAQKATGKEPFNASEKLLDLIVNNKKTNPYNDPELGTVPVNYLSTLDVTGGNSGSPTLNARGELVGLLFDGTYESINSDWDFDTKNTRSIHVDVRYMLWIMDELSDAENLLKEMEIEPHN